ncbi:hypothetical protein PLESTF_000327400 [Pleodorina starrii]|nr:hypothetical protein PLESTM_000434400 [Pleodorina starrii]GLC65671.1 hypothetical protein PLESTF_000327400 [Pleodorina starrii]
MSSELADISDLIYRMHSLSCRLTSISRAKLTSSETLGRDITRICRSTRRRNSPAVMPEYVHGLSLWPPVTSITIATDGMFSRILQDDLVQLKVWVNESPRNLLTVIVAKSTWDYELIAALRALLSTCYIIVWHPDATEDPMARIKAFQSGAGMVTNDLEHLQEGLRRITGIRGTGDLACPWCGLDGLSSLELWQHQPLYHIHEPDMLGSQCPACRRWAAHLTRHINLTHGPDQLADHRTGVFALAVVRRPTDGKFLLVQERHGVGYWLPGGGVDPGESLTAGVIREAWEEAGADIKVTGILTIDSFHNGQWRRIIFLAEPVPVSDAAAEATAAATDGPLAASPAAAEAAAAASDAPGPALRRPSARYRCKTLPDVESAGACWASVGQLEGLPLRSASEPMTWIPWVAGGGRVLPLDPAACPQLGQVFPDFTL